MPLQRWPERDRAIGARICLARTLAGLSRPALAKELAVGPDQVLRYERGTARVVAAMLEDLAAALGRPPAWFVETDHDAVARAACFAAPRGAILRRQFERAVDRLSRSHPAGATPSRKPQQVPV